MKKNYAAEFLVSSSTAIIIALLNFAINQQVNWVWVVIAFIVPFVVLVLYQGVVNLQFLRPYRKWKINKGELVQYYGKQKDNIWEFNTANKDLPGFYGPYIPLMKGKYKVVFRFKIDNRDEQDEPICDIDVT
jgi:hypothetical protein